MKPYVKVLLVDRLPSDTDSSDWSLSQSLDESSSQSSLDSFAFSDDGAA